MKKTAFLFSFVCCAFLFSYSQGTIMGKITDSSTSKPLGLATITVFKATDTVLITYRLSSPDGDFKVPSLPLNLECRVVISFSGYSVYRHEFMLTDEKPSLDLGTISMNPDAKSLDEVLLISERPPVIIKKDTIEFNASAFKTLPNALVEDLLKKLPGVQVDRDGNILVNGKPVNRILVDGKTFFGDDPKMATRNLPANVIDKVQVTDDKEEMMRNGDDNLNNVGKVINITLKKGVKKGWFGKLYAGGGTDNRYEAGGIANVYRDTLQVSVLGYMNNLNKAGFSYTELMQTGGFERNRSNTSSNSISIWNNSAGGTGVSINGINFGGLQGGGGISTSTGGGFNLNHAPSTKRSFFLQYFNGNVHVNRRNLSETKQFNEDTVITNNTQLLGETITHAHNIGLGARLKPDSVTNILINASYTLGNTDEGRASDIFSNNNKLGDLSHGDVLQNNLGKTRYYRHSVSITRLSKTKSGRRFTINQNLDINNRFNDNSTETELVFLYPSTFDSIAAQLRKERMPRTDASFNFNYSEPLGKKFTVRIGGRYEYGKLRNDINTFNRDGAPGFDIPNAGLSSEFERQSNRVLITPGLEFKWKDLTITPSARVLLQYVDNRLAATSIQQKQSNLLPALSVSYKQLYINYNRDIALPYYNYLLPVQDNSNPYFITLGNTALLPIERNSIWLNYNYNNTKRSLNMNVYINGSFSENDIIQSTTVDEKGVQTIMPVNANGSRSFYMYYGFSKQYKKNPKFSFSWNTGANINYNRNRLLYNGESSWQSTFNLGNWVGINLNWNDKIEINSTYGPGYNFTDYTSPNFKKLEVIYHWVDNELIVRWPKHIIWETQCSYTYNSRIPEGTPKGVVRWNGAVNFTMFKDETGVLKFSVFDILNKNYNISSYANRNMLSVSQTNTLRQYFMATFTYNVRAAGARKRIGGRERLFWF